VSWFAEVLTHHTQEQCVHFLGEGLTFSVSLLCTHAKTWLLISDGMFCQQARVDGISVPFLRFTAITAERKSQQ